MKSEYIEILERLKNKQRKDHMKGAVTGSVQANNRLMKELRDIYNSETFKKGMEKLQRWFVAHHFGCLVLGYQKTFFLFILEREMWS